MNAVADPNLPDLASQTVCEMCHGNAALFRYELFSTRASITGNCCLTCFLNVLRATTNSAGNAMGQDGRQGKILLTVSRKSEPAN